MGLPWVRLDANIATHDKTLRLLQHRDGYRLTTIMVFAFAWSGAHATDGFIPDYALAQLHALPRHVEPLVQVGAWDPVEGGWHIHNWEERQEIDVIVEAKRVMARTRALKANCIRWHGKDCGCWRAQADEES
jgi:hypothetical protein